MLETNNLEIIAFHYICSSTQTLTKVEPRVFNKAEVKLLYELIRKFYFTYSVIPDFKNTEQIRAIATENKEVQAFNPANGIEDNINEFLGLAKLIMDHPMDRYEPIWVKETVEGFIQFKYLETGIQTLVDWYAKDAKPTPDNVKKLVSQAQSIFLTRSTINLYEEAPLNFWQAESHVQIKSENLIKTGWPTFNMFLNGGFERKTLTHIWGAPNVGKSLFLGTIGKDVSVNGKNVFIGSLEMDPRKYAKRMGSSILGIAVSEYNEKDAVYFGQKLKDWKDSGIDDGRVHGQLYIQRFTHASPTTVTLAADKLAKELGIKWDLVIYDYLGELESTTSYSMDNMYALHKTNNAEIFDHAVNYDWAALTAHQVTADFFDAQDMNMKASAESRGISHRTDNIFGIIQDPSMFSAGKFFLKNLKARDNEYKNWYMRLNIDWKTMNLTDDSFPVKPTDQLML